MGPEALPFILAAVAGGTSGAVGALGNENVDPASFAVRDRRSAHYYDQDPRGLLRQSVIGTRNMGRAAADLANQPTTLPSAFVQPPPTLSGGGLPMPIGVRATDPAISDPSLLGLPGMNIGADPFGTSTVNPGMNPHASVGEDAGRGVTAVPGLAEATGAAQLLAELAQQEQERPHTVPGQDPIPPPPQYPPGGPPLPEGGGPPVGLPF